MINNLITEQDIKDYLMTSDFNEGLTEDESKFLLLKYRSFYRVTYSTNEHLKDTVDQLTLKLNDKEKELNRITEECRVIKEDLKLQLQTEKSRKLSWMERFYGKK